MVIALILGGVERAEFKCHHVEEVDFPSLAEVIDAMSQRKWTIKSR
jgi:hypothetical protein